MNLSSKQIQKIDVGHKVIYTILIFTLLFTVVQY